MKVQQNAYVALEYSLSLDDGEVVEQSDPGESLGFVVGAGHIVPGLERQLDGMEVGQTADIVVEAGEAYGEHDEELLHEVPRSSFPEEAELEVGMMMEARGPFGVRPIRVAELRDDVVVVDFNHPLAGERLHFNVKLTEVRASTAADLEALQGHDEEHECHGCGAHGPDGCAEHDHHDCDDPDCHSHGSGALN